jgi:microcystin-dependent protein
MAPDVPVPSSELSHKTVLIYIFVFLLIVCAIGAALYFFVFKKKSCKIDSDCSTGEICHDGKCQKLVPSNKCKSDNDCGNNQVCDINSGKCIAKPSQKQCQQDEDCGNGSCINNKCVFANFIIAFDTENLPDGWVECDGNNGTPDIRGRFIKGCTADDKNFGKSGGAKPTDYSNHMLTLAETYHEHNIPAQALDNLVKDGSEVSCFWSYLLIGTYNKQEKTSGIDGPISVSQKSIDLTPKCTSVIFAMPLHNTTNFFPIGSIIWFYSGSNAKPSLSNSDWTIYKNDEFFIGRDATHQLGKSFGSENITLDISNIPNHTHTFKYPDVPAGTNNCKKSDDTSCPDGNVFNDDQKNNTHVAPQTTKPNTSSQTSFDILPPYQPLFCIQKINGNKNDVPIGSICAWNSLTIPKGWLICDGNNKTPNLTAAFVLNEKSDTLGQKGGSDSVTLTQDNIPPHTHSYDFTQYNVGQNYCDSNGPYLVSGCYSGQDSSNPPINFPNTGMCDTNGGNCITSPNSSTPIKLDPPHIKLIYIMKTN